MEMDKEKKDKCSVSIIMPAFNEERYIKEALDSIFKGNSDFKDFEVQLVDDGSTDKTLSLVQKYYGDEPRLHIFYGDGQGVSHARNLALEHATGKYIIFCDADDRLTSGSLDVMVRRAEETDADLVIGRTRLFGRCGSSTSKASDQLAEFYEVIPANHPLLYRTLIIAAKLYRRQMLFEHNIRFLPIAYSEDAAFNMECVFSSKVIVGCCGDRGKKAPVIYEYRRHTFLESSSVTQQKRIPLWEDFITANKYIEDLIHKHIPAKEQDDYIEGFYIRHCENILREFWRYYWLCTPDLRKRISCTLQTYRGKLSAKAWNSAVYAAPGDQYLGIEKMLDIGGDEPAYYPFSLENGQIHFGLLVVIDPSIINRMLELILQSLYQQNFPSFGILLDQKQMDSLPAPYADMDNIFRYGEEAGKIQVHSSKIFGQNMKQVYADFVLNIRYPLAPCSTAITRMIQQMTEQPELTAVFANISSRDGLTFADRLINRLRRYLPSGCLGKNRFPLLCHPKYGYSDSIWRWDHKNENGGTDNFDDIKEVVHSFQKIRQTGNRGKFAQNHMAVFMDILSK